MEQIKLAVASIIAIIAIFGLVLIVSGRVVFMAVLS